MTRCLSCGKLIPALDCKHCPAVINVKCLGCGKIVQVVNEAKKKIENRQI